MPACLSWGRSHQSCLLFSFCLSLGRTQVVGGRGIPEAGVRTCFLLFFSPGTSHAHAFSMPVLPVWDHCLSALANGGEARWRSAANAVFRFTFRCLQREANHTEQEEYDRNDKPAIT